MSAAEGKAQGIPISELGVEQLSQLQKQVEQEYAFFHESATQLKTFIERNEKSIVALKSLDGTPSGTQSLIPLSESMYIRAELSDPSKMLVEIGTGYFAEMPREKAISFFDRKKAYIQAQLDTIEKILVDKKRTRAILSENLQQKIAERL